jgi:archaellum biogenesis protein FlaJ (TadC family)
MPRPTAAQLAYGSCTVIFSTLAMLLLSQTSSVAGIAVIAVAALALGVLVGLTVRLPTSRTVAQERPATEEPVRAAAPASIAPVRAEPVRERAAS